MCRVSIVVPIYHGKKYIPFLIRQAEECRKYADEDTKIELLLVNDAPDDLLDMQYRSESVEIIVLNTDVNRGIHGARVRGVRHCTGEYVLLLDQDDRIMPQYVHSQLSKIGMADAVVCRCIHENKPYYNEDYPFERMMCKDYMLEEGCPVISPGQVLIRKNAVPKIWMENIMQSNCADDFLLWLSMTGEGREFALNQDILFEHVVSYNNTSWNSLRMMESEAEMVRILKNCHAFSEEDVIRLDRMLYKIKKKHLSNLDKFRKMFYILNDWTTLREKGNRITGYLKRQGYQCIAVYGVGYLGRHLLLEIEGNEDDVRVRYLIDRNVRWIQTKYNVYTLEDKLEKTDAIIVTLVQGEEKVVEELEDKTGAVVYTIRNLVNIIGEENCIWSKYL